MGTRGREMAGRRSLNLCPKWVRKKEGSKRKVKRPSSEERETSNKKRATSNKNEKRATRNEERL
jgi:hypothetical protein